MPQSRLARVYQGTDRNLARLARLLRDGEIVAVPTETVYGLAGNALDPAACRKIFRAKARPTNDPLIVHIGSLPAWERLAIVNEPARSLARAFWPGPLTIVLPKRPLVPAIVSSGLPTVAVRMPRHRLFRRLIQLAGVPLAAPSANPFGYVSPTNSAHVLTSLGRRIGHILEGGPCRIGVESTIVDLRDAGAPKLLRPGAITRAQLEHVLGCKVLTARRTHDSQPQVAPGSLTRHYSPRTTAMLHHKIRLRDVQSSPLDEAWVFASRPKKLSGPNIFWLGEHGSLTAAARHLFGILRSADDGRFRILHLERVHGSGLAEAINDRLQRAAARSQTSNAAV